MVFLFWDGISIRSSKRICRRRSRARCLSLSDPARKRPEMFTNQSIPKNKMLSYTANGPGVIRNLIVFFIIILLLCKFVFFLCVVAAAQFEACLHSMLIFSLGIPFATQVHICTEIYIQEGLF